MRCCLSDGCKQCSKFLGMFWLIACWGFWKQVLLMLFWPQLMHYSWGYLPAGPAPLQVVFEISWYSGDIHVEGVASWKLVLPMLFRPQLIHYSWGKFACRTNPLARIFKISWSKELYSCCVLCMLSRPQLMHYSWDNLPTARTSPLARVFRIPWS